MSKQTPTTIKVRIAVCVNDRSEWNATGWWTRRASHTCEEDAPAAARDGMPESEDGDAADVVYWITADVPVPTRTAPETIEGVVEGEAK